ncbi:MAG: histone deacetylase [Gemmatimonadales bacterium]|nr:MAG: histone deacetylase [Gemmatimonadales bacterium]
MRAHGMRRHLDPVRFRDRNLVHPTRRSPRHPMPPRRPLRRLGRLMGRALGLDTPIRDLPLIYHRDYRRGITGVPMDPMRGERVLAFLLNEGWVRLSRIETPRPSSVENLRRVHSGEYLRSLDDPETVGRILGVPLGPDEATGALELQRLIAGGTIQTTRLALRDRTVAINLGGGFHHAGPDRGTGFCLLNDVAVAVARLRARGYEEPILVVDLDIHDGNGTRAAFAEDPTVHTFSLHNETWDENPDAVADTCVAFGAGIEDAAFLEILQRELPPVVRSHRPGLTVYIAGVDLLAGDHYGDGAMTLDGVFARDRFVVEALEELDRSPALAVTLGGGYGSSAWRPTARFLAWLLTGNDVRIPDDLTVALDRVEWADPETESSDDPFSWSFSGEDLAALGAGPGGESLLLGRYPRSRVEAELERFGVVEQARARGYRETRVEILPSSGLGPTVRLHGGTDPEVLLMEARLDLDRATLPGVTLLVVEWLLLQDPRGSTRPERPKLPGQEHPGLGALADVVAWLVTLCRDVELDGLTFRSSHFHMAVLARRHLGFLRRQDQLLFERIRELTRHLPLAEASREVEAGGIRDPETGEVLRWSGVQMVVPVSEALRSRLPIDR